ncbi:MAG TPA: GAF domain-containing protein [Ktedonobacteraceae bacterium]|nr:GAF domain-containing protein [Ktedonobacteraceae bacterium]
MPGESSLYTSNHEHGQLLKALRESELLREISELLASSLDPTHILQVLVRRTTEVCEVERCAVWLLDSTRGIFLPSAYHLSAPHLNPQDVQKADKVWYTSSLPVDDPLFERLLAQNRMLTLSDMHEEQSATMQKLAEKFLIRSLLLVALVREGRLMGIMSLDNPGQVGTFSQEQQQLARSIGQQAAVAIDNAQLYQQAQKERNRAERLTSRAQSIYTVAMAVNSGKDLTSVLETAVQHLVRGAEATGAAVALLAADILTFASTIGLHPPQTEIKLHELPHCQTSTENGSIAFIKSEQLVGNEKEWLSQMGIEHALVVPLMIGVQSRRRRRPTDATDTQRTHCVGLLFVNYASSQRQPSQGQYAFAQDIATQCALAIEKKHILDEAQRAAALATERANTLDAVLNAMNEGILVVDMEGRVIVHNSTAAHFLGLTPQGTEPVQTFLQHQPTFTLDGRPLPIEDFPIMRALRGAAVRGERFMTQRADGSERAVEVNVVPLFDDEAQKIGLVSAFRDVTEQARVDRRIRTVLDALLHAAEVVSGISDMEEILHRVLAMTLKALNCERGVVHCYDHELKAFTPLLSIGFTPEAEVQWQNEQRRWLMPAEDDYAGFHAQLLAGHAILVNEEQCPEHPNAFHNTMILAAPITHNDHLLGVMMLDRSPRARSKNQRQEPKRGFNVWDIAVVAGIAQFAGLAIEQTRWQQEAKIARTNEATMRETNAMKDEFLAITAHEFRTPLTIILAHSQMMARVLRRLPNQDVFNKLYDSMNNIETQTHQLTNIVGTFLEVTQLNRGQVTLNQEDFDLEDVVEESVSGNAATSTLHSISYTVEPAAHPYFVHGDRARLLQIFANLLQNAIKYSPPGSPITITLSQRSQPEGKTMIEVSIADQGIGVPPEAQEHLFERFYRAPNIAGSQTRGVGLGLYVVAEFLRLHGGEIHVESSGIIGEGSRFIFTLPLLLESTTND